MTKSRLVTAGSANRQPPRRRRKETRPAELIEAGLQEFLERGYAGSRLEDVARRAGAAKGTIYRYFADKEALFEAAIRSRIAPVFDDLGALAGRHEGTTRELLTVIVTTLHRRVLTSDMPHLMRIILAESPRFPGLAEWYYRETVARGAALLGAIVERGKARGEVRPGAAADLPIALIGPAVLGALWRMTFERIAPLDGEALLAAHLDLVCDGLLTPAPAQSSDSARPSA